VTPKEYVKRSLELYVNDPPDSDFQKGFHEALKVVAHEALGFEATDPLLWGTSAPAPRQRQRPQLTLIDGGLPPDSK